MGHLLYSMNKIRGKGKVDKVIYADLNRVKQYCSFTHGLQYESESDMYCLFQKITKSEEVN